jgi:hypothetical protein
MSRLWGAVIIVGMLFFGCTSVRTKPVELDLPMNQKHFIVMDHGDRPPR